MKPRIYILISVMLLMTVQGWAQQLTAREAFMLSPDYVFPVLSSEMKQDLVALYEAGQKDSSYTTSTANLAGGLSHIETLESDFLRLHLDRGTEIQIKLLPMINRTALISMVVTSKVAPEQSIVKFYSETWQEVSPSDIINLPEVSDFLRNPADKGSVVLKNALVERGSLDYTVHYEAHCSVMTIKLTTFDEEMVRRLYTEVVEMLDPTGVKYEWTGTRFKKMK